MSASILNAVPLTLSNDARGLKSMGPALPAEGNGLDNSFLTQMQSLQQAVKMPDSLRSSPDSPDIMGLMLASEGQDMSALLGDRLPHIKGMEGIDLDETMAALKDILAQLDSLSDGNLVPVESQLSPSEQVGLRQEVDHLVPAESQLLSSEQVSLRQEADYLVSAKSESEQVSLRKKADHLIPAESQLSSSEQVGLRQEVDHLVPAESQLLSSEQVSLRQEADHLVSAESESEQVSLMPEVNHLVGDVINAFEVTPAENAVEVLSSEVGVGFSLLDGAKITHTSEQVHGLFDGEHIEDDVSALSDSIFDVSQNFITQPLEVNEAQVKVSEHTEQNELSDVWIDPLDQSDQVAVASIAASFVDQAPELAVELSKHVDVAMPQIFKSANAFSEDKKQAAMTDSFGGEEELDGLKPGVDIASLLKRESFLSKPQVQAVVERGFDGMSAKIKDAALSVSGQAMEQTTQKVSTADLAMLNRQIETSSVTKQELPPMTKPFNHPEWKQEFNERILWMHNKSIPSAELRLNPNNLGPISIKIQMDQDQQASIQIHAHNAGVREAIEASIPKLREMLNAQQLNLADVNVSQQNQGQGGARQAMQDALKERSNGSGSVVDGVVAAEGDGIAGEINQGRVISSNGLLSLYA